MSSEEKFDILKKSIGSKLKSLEKKLGTKAMRFLLGTIESVEFSIGKWRKVLIAH